jgi:hypothetical protein
MTSPACCGKLDTEATMETDELHAAQRIYAATTVKIERDFWREVEKLREKRLHDLNEAYQACQRALRMEREGQEES